MPSDAHPTPASSPGELVTGKRGLFWMGVVLTLVLDQGTKALLWRPAGQGGAVDVIPGLLRLVSHPGNVRGVFGLGPSAQWFYMAAGVAGVAVIALVLVRSDPRNGVVCAALGMLAGGAVGNVVDRVAFGAVRDFIDLYWGPHHWPTFNVADSAICVGFALIVLDSLLARGRDARRGHAGEERR